MLAAAGRRSGCLARRHRVVRDDQRGLAAVHEAMPGAGMLVTSGGVSMGGEQDVVKAARAETRHKHLP